MKIPVFALLAPLVCLTADAQTTPSVGSGAPTAAIQQSFMRVFFRNNFNSLVSLPPIGNVKALGSQGLVQEFTDASNSANKYALAKPNVNQPALAGDADMVQFYPALYSYYTSVGASTAGYPTTDTLKCPSLVSMPGNTCQYQLFDKPYALFAFANAVSAGGTTFALTSALYPKWLALGGIAGVGPATSTSATATSASGIAFTYQTFDQGAIFNMTSGTLSGRTVGVSPGVYATYAANGGYTGFLGLPLTDEQVLASGNKQQPFEGGSIEYNPSGGPPIVHYPVSSIAISPSLTLDKLNLGDTIVLTATPYDPNGNALTDRTITWTTSNSRILSLQPAGLSVTVKAIAGGTATVVASGGGKSSPAVTFIVTAPCCGIGEGAPTPAMQQAFQDAVNRNRLTLQLPAPLPVRRSGAGLIQTFRDASGASYAIELADGSSTAYVVAGPILTKYNALGGPTGVAGYPTSDATPGGRQLFSNQNALAGNPVQLVSGALLVRWAALGYETGSIGSPTGALTSVLTFRATLGSIQAFASGLLVSAQSGPASGQVYLIGGLIAAAFSGAGGAGGSLGLALSDEYSLNGLRRQDFEGGYVDYTSGAQAAQIHLGNRQPLVSATPSTVLVGTRVRLAVGGFAAGASVTITVSGQTPFTVTTDSGAYIWDALVPANASSGTVSIHAADTKAGVSADGSYAVRSATEIVLQLTKAAGDGQTGLPGATLSQPLDLLVRDVSGNPIAGIPVQFVSSPGAQIVSASLATGGDGHATALVRLPSSDGLSLISATAGKQGVTFSAQAQHGGLANFPKMTQANSPATDVPLGNGTATVTRRGALLTSAAAILRYFQNRGDLPTPNGFADPLALNQFLRGYCAVDAQGNQICDGFLNPAGASDQIVNLWRLASSAGGNLDVSVEKPDLAVLRDFLSQGSPILLALSIAAPGGNSVPDYVVATGVNVDGGIAVMDPNPAFGLSALTASTTVTGAVRLVPRAPSSRGFLLAGTADLALYSPAGSCGTPLRLNLESVAGTFGFVGCDGSQDQYQLDTLNDTAFQLTLTDLGTSGGRSDLSGSGAAAFEIFRNGAQWTAAPQTLQFTAAGVVNGATFTPDLAPGSLFTVFGAGLAGSVGPTGIQINGVSLTLIAATPFQISAALPLDLVPGTYTLSLSSPYGNADQPITIKANAPAVFLIGPDQAAVVNQDGSINSAAAPVKRGQTIVIYCTGLGAVTNQGSLKVAATPVSVQIGNAQVRPAFAGLTPGFVGLYQINVAIPAANPPGLSIPLVVTQGDAISNTISIAVQ